jgi:hypothetical protein
VRAAAVCLSAALIFALASAGGASAKTVWLCKPGLKDNPCLDELTTTVVRADGTSRIERRRPARKPEIDCFYVYPTVSGQSRVQATRGIDPEIRGIASAQVARFSTVCRPFAPVYRQFTISAIGDPSSITPARSRVVFRDVARAWRLYLRRYNRGRGFVLIGHSQGTFILRELVARFIDRRTAVRRRLVSALLIGGNVSVRTDRDRGGDFKNVRACRRAGQIGCVVAYSTFYGTPPADARFGVPASPNFGSGDLSGLEALCTDPTLLSRSRGVLRPYFPTRPLAGPIGLVQDRPPPGLGTPWVATPALYRARCASADGRTWLQVRDAGRPGDSRPRVTESLGPLWGLHLYDVNLPFGNLVAIVKRQAKAFARR